MRWFVFTPVWNAQCEMYTFVPVAATDAPYPWSMTVPVSMSAGVDQLVPRFAERENFNFLFAWS